ncbi:MAG TPA: tetratricopeptide repeat protein [Candidatus Acidoferrales bacterium]|nr:tetratricopeptide repeat protein [Candidatus Acidoferrales bacterium]
MKRILTSAISAILFGVAIASTGAAARPQPAAQAQVPAPSSTSGKPANPAPSADAYYYFSMGHLQELQFELTSSGDAATESIESYKKALELEPGSAVILERLAEIYAKSQHIRDAVIQAQAALKIDPDNVDAHRLLARIYVRTLGDMTAGEVQQENLTKAVEQFQAILKVDPSDTYSSLWLARLYRFENQHAEAEKVLRGVLTHDSENGPALEQLSQLLIDEGRSQEAIDLLTHAAGDTASPDIYDLLGDAYSQAKDYAKAEDAYQKAIAGDPDDPGHRHGLAQALMEQNKYAEALEQYKKLSELEPGTSENYLRAAQLYRRLGQFDQAESSLLRAKQLAPGSLEILYNEALLYQDEGRYDDAVKVLADAIAGIKSQAGGEGSPSALAILYEQLGRAYREQRNYSAAIETFEEMAKLNADSQKRAQVLIIDTYRQSRDIDRAIAETKKALAQSSDASELTVTLAMLYGEKSDTATAKQLLEGLLHGNDSDQEIYIDIAQVETRGKKYAEAEQSAQKAEQMAREAGGKETAWFMLGSIYERQKKFDQAEQQFRKVLDANPNNAPALNYYGYMLADRGIRVEEATSLIQRALKQEPNNGAYLDSLGWAYYKQNKLAEAEENLRKAVDHEGQDPTILSHLASVYLKLGQNERAAELFERSLSEWQKALPADYEPDKVNEVEAQLKNLKRRLAQKSTPETAKPQ